jgi:hypothetical protein
MHRVNMDARKTFCMLSASWKGNLSCFSIPSMVSSLRSFLPHIILSIKRKMRGP